MNYVACTKNQYFNSTLNGLKWENSQKSVYVHQHNKLDPILAKLEIGMLDKWNAGPA